MGLMSGLMTLLFGDGRNLVMDTMSAFRENPEAAAGRELRGKEAALAQFAQEFRLTRRGLFDRLIDAINRLPRPALALGTIALFAAAMWAPEWFAARMEGVAMIPEPLWWLMGAIVSFYFGARHQAKGQEFQRSVVQSVVMSRGRGAPPALTASGSAPNAALAEWRAQNAN